MPPKFVYMSRGEERERGKEREKERMSTYECVCVALRAWVSVSVSVCECIIEECNHKKLRSKPLSKKKIASVFG